MGCAATKPDVSTFPTHGDVDDFVRLHCELDPKAHTAYNEVASALLVFLQTRGRTVSALDFMHWRKCVQVLIDDHGLTQQGPQVDGPRPMSYVFLVGIRVKQFSDVVDRILRVKHSKTLVRF